MEKLKVLDLFSGIGGFSLGLERTGGFETVAFCEIEKFPQAVLRRHWPGFPIFEDVRTLTKDALDAVGIGPIDIITGGFPCQDLSSSGTGKGLDGERSGLFSEIIRLACELRPRYILMENSPNLLSGNGGKWARRAFGRLSEIGYDAEWQIIPASYAGAPHRRERVWIIAYPTSLGQSRQGRLNYAVNPAPNAYREASGVVHAFQRKSLPFVCRGHDGLSAEVDPLALGALGNSVVPQIPEIIGRAILEAETPQP